MSTVAIIDYGMCNLDSVVRAVEECGYSGYVTSSVQEVAQASRIILPGVGSFAEAMENIVKKKLDVAIRSIVLDGHIPFLGICLGMQLMATVGNEGGKTNGLNLIPGTINLLKADESQHERIPHIGWNEVCMETGDEIFHKIAPNSDFYFVHSYHFCCDAKYVLGRTPYCGGFASVIRSGNAYGVQFHPEKSQDVGFQLLRNFLSIQ